MRAGGYAPAPTERPHTIHTWIQHLIMERIQDGGIQVASALQARMHSVLSAAMLAFEQCRYDYVHSHASRDRLLSSVNIMDIVCLDT